MLNEILKDVSSRLKKQLKINQEHVVFSASGYKSADLSVDNFHHIRPEATSMQTGYVDGGESTIYESSGTCLSFVRIFGHIERGGTTVETLKQEFYALVEADDKLFFKVKCYPVKGKAPAELVLDSMDNRIKNGVDRAKPHRVVSILRKISELQLSLDLISKMETGDMLVLDGTLETRFEDEKKVMTKLFNKAQKSGVLMTAVSKGTGLLTNLGKPVDRLLFVNGPHTPWFYHPVVEIKSENHKAVVILCKLHARSKHVLRTEIFKEQALVDPGKVFAVLAFQSRDLAVPGYPYGLIKADKFARVTENEREYIKNRFAKLDEIFGSDLHGVLDSIY